MRANGYKLSQKSKTALKTIYKYTLKNFGEEQAIIYLKGLHETFATIVEAFDDTKSKVILMSGLPASGKDHWLKNHHPNFKQSHSTN
jgi:hypothetical protein